MDELVESGQESVIAQECLYPAERGAEKGASKAEIPHHPPSHGDPGVSAGAMKRTLFRALEPVEKLGFTAAVTQNV